MKALVLALCLFPCLCFGDDGILVVGDSNTLRPMSYIRDALPCAHHSPGNARDTQFIIDNLPGWLIGKNYRIIYFNSGLWDIARRIPTPEDPWTLDPTDEAPMAVDPDQYRFNLNVIAEMLKTWSPGSIIIFATSTDVPVDSIGRLPANLRRYNAIAKSVMDQQIIEVDDRYAFMLPYAYLHTDENGNKVHYTSSGNQIMASHIVDILQAHGGC